MENFVDYQNLKKPTFNFPGNYRAIVEDTQDPEGVGRVRVRILGVHSLDPKVTPVDHLPWAEPALSLYYGGGLMTRKNLNDTIENTDQDRYLPRKDLKGELSNIPPENVAELTPNDGMWKDTIMEECGASAVYTVPRKGSMVWVFFENDSHIRPQYWAAASRKIDWEEQRTKINDVISFKRDEVNDLRDRTLNGAQQIDKDEHADSTQPVERLKVKTAVPDPKLFIHTLDGIRNEDITSFTSSFGTTYVIVNKNGQERTYIFHRGHSQYIDHKGQVKTLVGVSDNRGDEKREETDSESTDQENDYQMMVANNYDLHVIGDFNVYAQQNIFLDAEKDLYAVVKRNAGVVVKEGDLDIMCEKGHANISCPEGNVNVRCQEMQAKVEKNLVLEVTEDVDAQIKGNVFLNVDGTLNAHVKDDINIVTDASFNLECGQDFNITAVNLNENYSGSWAAVVQQNTDITTSLATHIMAGGSSTLELTSGIASVSGPNANINGANVTIGGNVSMGFGTQAGPATPTVVPPLIVDPWQQWRDNPEKVTKSHEPTEQVVTDEDSA